MFYEEDLPDNPFIDDEADNDEDDGFEDFDDDGEGEGESEGNDRQDSNNKNDKNKKNKEKGKNNKNPQQNGTDKLANKGTEKAAQEGTKKAGEQAVKQGAQKATQQAVVQGGSAATTAGAGAGLGVVLFWVVVVIVIIIILVGLIFFLLSMPGQVTQKLKELGLSVMNAFQSVIEGNENVIPPEEIADVANYLESMGYDLKGEGFVSSEKKEISTKLSQEVISNSYYDDSQDVWRHNDTNEVVDLNSDPILTYTVSDNLCYLIKNFNQNLDEATGGYGKAVFTGFVIIVAVAASMLLAPIAAIVATVAVVAGSAFAFSMASNPSWGTGLISIWKEGSDIGIAGGAYKSSERGYIELDAGTKQLNIKRGWTNNAYTFNVEGWTGRYGMPLEFLLSVHIATQMPDLAIDMATSFDTDIELLLHDVDGGTITAGIKVGDNEYLSWKTIEKIVTKENNLFQDLWNGLAGLTWGNITGSEDYKSFTIDDITMQRLFDEKVSHAEDCTCCSHINSANVEYEEKDGKNVKVEEVCDDDEVNLDPESGEFEIGEHLICDKCKAFAKKIVMALKKIQDNKWESYTPYISKVTNHWFRDVYFVIENPSNTEVMKIDEDYFYETNERWTMYETYGEDDTIPEGFEVGDYKLYTYKEDGTYELSTLTKAEVEELNEKLANGDTSVTKLVKKSLGTKMTSNDGNRWIAYEKGDDKGEMPWTALLTTSEAPEILQDEEIKDILYYKESRPSDIVQIEDGQRGATNEKIKNMFINNKYYQYDGTTEKADLIESDRKKVSKEYDNEELSELINTDDDPRDESLLGKVSLARDSLAAFSMLENTHTLDADYIYKDFKELIVELDYFDKEDLADKIDTVMQWIIPDTSASGWPVRKYEKGETFYGTLINSKTDLELIRTADIAAAEATLEGIENEVEEDTTVEDESKGNVPNGSVSQLVAKGYEVHKIMEVGNGWDYCVEDRNRCNHKYGHACGLSSTIQEAQAGHHNTCCATFVSWVLKEVGFDLSNHPGMHGAKNTYDWCKAEGWTPITDYSQLEPGDLLFNKSGYTGTDTSNIGHVQILGNNGEWLNAGSVDAINDPPEAYDASFIIGMRSHLSGAKTEFQGYEPNQDVVSPITGKVIEYGEVERINEETGQRETVEFIKIEAIHNYLYDTEKPKGEAYKTNQVYEEGCKKIDDDKYTYFEETAPDNAKQLEGYDYFYEEYQGVLDGFVMYIEGFDLTLFDSNGAKALVESGTTTGNQVTRYEPNTVYNMTDDLKEAQALWKEDAKAAALPLVTIDEDLYIKEGTVIGKTYPDQDMSGTEVVTQESAEETSGYTGNGNYIRVILRDLEDSIVEDVETYFKITDTYSFNGSAINIQNIDSINPELEALIEQLAGPLEAEYPGIVNILKAISMNESSGGNNPSAGDDPMQAAESTGAEAGSSMGSWERSVEAGIAALTNAWDRANDCGIQDLRIVIQAYNFGSGFVDYMYKNGVMTYDKSLVESFSNQKAAENGWERYGDKEYVDPKIYNYLPDLNV